LNLRAEKESTLGKRAGRVVSEPVQGKKVIWTRYKKWGD